MASWRVPEETDTSIKPSGREGARTPAVATGAAGFGERCCGEKEESRSTWQGSTRWRACWRVGGRRILVDPIADTFRPGTRSRIRGSAAGGDLVFFMDLRHSGDARLGGRHRGTRRCRGGRHSSSTKYTASPQHRRCRRVAPCGRTVPSVLRPQQSGPQAGRSERSSRRTASSSWLGGPLGPSPETSAGSDTKRCVAELSSERCVTADVDPGRPLSTSTEHDELTRVAGQDEQRGPVPRSLSVRPGEVVTSSQVPSSPSRLVPTDAPRGHPQFREIVTGFPAFLRTNAHPPRE